MISTYLMQDLRCKTSLTRGFSLIEMLVAMGIFSVLMLIVSQVFSSQFENYRQTREVQRNVESVQYAMNTLAKELRTSTVVNRFSALGAGNNNQYRGITFYDYSQGRCFNYFIDNATNSFKAKWVAIGAGGDADPVTTCRDHDFTLDPEIVLSTGFVDVSNTTASRSKFYVIQSDNATNPKVIGRVTLVLTLKQNAASTKSVTIQTSVSLRDYNYVGI